MDLEMDYTTTKAAYLLLGDKGFFGLFSQIFKRFSLYTMSTSWINSSQYILKFKGTQGDVVVRWNN